MRGERELPVGSSLLNFTDKGSMRCVADENGNVIFASSSLGWHLGTCASLLTSKNIDSILNIVSSCDGGGIPENFNNVNSGIYEVALQRKSRDPLLLQARIDLIDAPNGRKYKVIWLDPDNQSRFEKPASSGKEAKTIASFVDDTEKKAKKIKDKKYSDKTIKSEELSLSAEKGDLEQFIAMNSDILAVYDKQGVFLRGNSALNVLSGYSDSELKHFSFMELIFPEDRPVAIKAISGLYGDKTHKDIKVSFETRVCGKNGMINFVKWTYKMSGDCVYVLGRDVTEIKEREEEVHYREKQLFEAQKIGRMGNWSLDFDSKCMEWSDQIYSIFGVEKGRFIPTITKVSQLLVSEDRHKIYREFHKAMHFKSEYSTQFRVALPDGDTRYIYCEGRCRIDPETGEVSALYGIMHDITETTLHERALNDAKDAAESAYASKTRFLANMSHELRTPLNAIIGFSEMMQQQLLGPLGSARYLDYIGGIRQSGEHLLDLINDMLDMSKIEIGKYEINPEEINISKLIRLAVHMVEGRAQDAGINIVTDKIDDNIVVSADRRGLMQIVLNILSNSVKFTNPGGYIDIECHELGNKMELVITDNGIGIPSDKIDVVTKPFEQVRDQYVRNHTGSGLGLAITKDLVELHKGSLSIASKEGEGTSVFVILPRLTEKEKSSSEEIIKRKFSKFFSHDVREAVLG